MQAIPFGKVTYYAKLVIVVSLLRITLKNVQNFRSHSNLQR
jgi:hypothetical protein